MSKSFHLKAAALTACLIFAPAFCTGAARVESGPFRAIRTLQDLDNMRNDLSGSYILMNDIDASATRNWDGGAGWKPIGAHGRQFTGVFNGRGHTISGLYINRPDENNVGLFGLAGLSAPAVIRNVRLEGVDITGRNATGALVGSLIPAGCIISNSYAAGRVNGNEGVGGLVGTAVSYGEGIIKNSYSSASVRGRSEVGGLAGVNGTIIEESFSTGSVEAQEWDAGGLVGNLYYTSSWIINSYSTASVRGGRNVGGLVGLMRERSRVRHSYSAGTVAGESDVGGLVGFATGGGITASYWDKESSGIDASRLGSGKTTREMTTHATFNEWWDFENVWAILSGESYPFLRWQRGIAPIPVPGQPPFPGPIPEVPDVPDIPDVPELPEPRFPDPRPAPPENLRAAPGDGEVTLAWDESPSAGIESYRVYVRVPESVFKFQASVPADITGYTHRGLTNDVKYIYTVRSFSELGLESGEASNFASAVPGTDEAGEGEPPSPGELPPPEGEVPDEEEGDDDSSGCFIATAAYGSCMSSEVGILRTLRDEFLHGSGTGNCFVRAYYAASPALAGVVEENNVLRLTARLHLAPFVKAAGWMVN